MRRRHIRPGQERPQRSKARAFGGPCPHRPRAGSAWPLSTGARLPSASRRPAAYCCDASSAAGGAGRRRTCPARRPTPRAAPPPAPSPRTQPTPEGALPRARPLYDRCRAGSKDGLEESSLCARLKRRSRPLRTLQGCSASAPPASHS